jgi:hypothetical protein
MNKPRIIQESMRCHHFAWLSLLPGLGLLVAPATLIRCGQIRGKAGQEWNAAGDYLRRAFWLAAFGLTYQALLIMWLVVMQPDFAAFYGTSTCGT